MKEELKSLKELLKKAKEESRSVDYALQVREGRIKRTILSEVYNGTEFDN